MSDNSLFIHIGFGNMVNISKVTAIVSPDSAPIKRLVQTGKEEGIVIDATQGRRTKAVIITENGKLILSALLPETISARADYGKDYNKGGTNDEKC